MGDSKGRLPADNPTTALFDLAEEMAKNYEKIKYIKYYAYAFIGIALFLLIILFISALDSGNLAFAIIVLAIIISGIILLRLIILTKNFMEHFYVNFNAIRTVREIDPMPPVPEGKTPLERIERYLVEHDPEIKKRIGQGAMVKRSFSLGQRTWDLAVVLENRFMAPRYLALVKVMHSLPKLADILAVEKDLESLPKVRSVPNRVIILYRGGKNYDGLSDDFYTYLTEKEHFVISNGKKHRIKLQVFIEANKRYEIIPLLP